MLTIHSPAQNTLEASEWDERASGHHKARQVVEHYQSREYYQLRVLYTDYDYRVNDEHTSTL
jgi:hypothetical protein